MTECFHLRILMLSAEYPPTPGGVGDYTRALGLALAARGHDVSVLTGVEGRPTVIRLSRPESTRAVDDLGATPAPTNPQSTTHNPPFGWGWKSWRTITSALAELRPDVLHVQYQTGAYDMHPAINLLPWRLKRIPDRPLVAVTAHDLLPPYLFPKAGPLRTWVTRRLLTDAGAAVVTNEADAATLRGWGLAPALIPIGSNIAVAPPQGYSREAWRAQLGVAPGETLVAFFGLISRTKGLDALLDALERLTDTRLLIIGGEAPAPQDREYAASIRRRVAEGPLRERVRITGHCTEEQVSAYLLAADLAALPFSDGASFRRGSLLAALAHGVPTVTTGKAERGALKDEARAGAKQRDADISQALQPLAFGLRPLRDGESVLFVPPGDVGALAGAIQRLAEDAALRERLGEAGRDLAAQFGWEAIAVRHEKLYQGRR
ncbi:MAG: hypothetical protein RLZZ387_5591 [Chloroflexota bacterium]